MVQFFGYITILFKICLYTIIQTLEFDTIFLIFQVTYVHQRLHLFDLKYNASYIVTYDYSFNCLSFDYFFKDTIPPVFSVTR